MKLTFDINGKKFRTATRGLAHARKLRDKHLVRFFVISVNNEPIRLVELEEHAKLEAEEKAHNKRQGL